jgi:hypothetical protein
MRQQFDRHAFGGYIAIKSRLNMQMPKLGDKGTVEARNGPIFIITHTWPEIRNAEYEVLQRLAVAANNIGATMIAIDNDGRPLWANRHISLDASKSVDPSEIDFMISLHFQSPRLIDVYSYYALWQPLDFYFQFGYDVSLKNMLSHNDCLSCRSDFADAHGRITFGARGGLNPQPFPTLFHNVPQPYLEPRIDEQSRLFYIGINWEKGGRPKGRHAGVFELLDGDNLLDIYGPRKLLNFEPWEGFKSYRGELPFDGLSTVTAINKAGICLALSSEAHKRAGLMSNRLFEGLAAGAAVIVDSNRFAKKHFSDVVYFIDDRGSEEDVAFQIKTIVEGIRRDPEKAIARVRKGQERLAERFSLEGSLLELIETHPKRVAHYRSTVLSAGSVSVIMTHHDGSLDSLLDMIAQAANQTLVSVDLVLICDKAFFERHSKTILAAGRGCVRAITPLLLDLARCERVAGQPPVQVEPTGPMIAETLKNLNTEYFCFLRSDELWFHDHLASLIGAIRRQAGAIMAASGVLEQSVDAAKTSRSVAELRFVVNGTDLWNGQYASEYGRFLFSRSVVDHVPMDCLLLLDGQEPNLVRLMASLQGDPAQTCYATYVRDTAKTEALSESIIPEEQQQQFIRDAVAFDSRWLSRMAQTPEMPSHIYAYSRGAPVRFDQFQHPFGVSMNLPIDHLVETSLSGDGAKYIEHGFSLPEKEGTWIEADFGALEFFCAEQTWATARDYDLVVYMRGRNARDTGRPQHCTVVLNGVAVAYVELPEFNTRFAFRVPRNAFPEDGRMRVQLIPDHSELVYDQAGKVVDGRRLSIHVQRFGLISRLNASRPVIVPGQPYEFGEGSQALATLRDGLVYLEHSHALLLGKGAHLSFRVQDFMAPMSLRLWLTDQSKGNADSPQQVSVLVNGAQKGAFGLSGADASIDIPLHAADIDDSGICAVTLEFDRAIPDDGNDDDNDDGRGRLLAAQLRRMQIIDLRPPPPVFVPGQPYEFGEASPALAALRGGVVFSPERSRALLLGRGAQLRFEVQDFMAPMSLRLWLTDQSKGADDAPQYVSVLVNGAQKGAFSLSGADAEIDIPLDAADVDDIGIFAVSLEFDRAISDVGDGRGRLLAAQLHRMQIINLTLPPPVLVPEQPYDFGEASLALAALRGGVVFSPERSRALLLGRGAHLNFKVQDFKAPMGLRLWLTDQSKGADDAPQYVSVLVNGAQKGAFGLSGPDAEIVIPLDAADVDDGGVYAVTLEFDRAIPDADDGHGRLLAAQLHRMQIIDLTPPPPPRPNLVIRAMGRLQRAFKALLGRP